MGFSAETCRRAANILTVKAPDAPEPALMDLCAHCLSEIADKCPHYNGPLRITRRFLRQGGRLVEAICAARDEEALMLHDMAFELVECITLTAREHLLVSDGTRQAPPAQAELMRFFEDSEHWRPGDGTLVSDFYYITIPATARSTH